MEELKTQSEDYLPETKQSHEKLDALVEGEEAPLIRWASFDDTNVKGAFIANTNTILINEGLKG